jgi:hypothetical protein
MDATPPGTPCRLHWQLLPLVTGAATGELVWDLVWELAATSQTG